MATDERKHHHVEYYELNGCHFNSIAEEFEEEDQDSTNPIIR